MLVTPHIEQGQHRIRLETTDKTVTGDGEVRAHGRRGGDVRSEFFRPGNVIGHLIIYRAGMRGGGETPETMFAFRSPTTYLCALVNRQVACALLRFRLALLETRGLD